MDIEKIRQIITKASKQIPKGIKIACTDSLKLKAQDLLAKEGYYPTNEQEKRKLNTLIQKKQSTLVKKYLKRERDSKKGDWKDQEIALKTACQFSNIDVINTLLLSGIKRTYPTPDNQADKILLNSNEKVAQTVLSFYSRNELKELILKDPKRAENINKSSKHGLHSPYRNFPPEWLVTLAKKELGKKMLESKNKERTILIVL